MLKLFVSEAATLRKRALSGRGHCYGSGMRAVHGSGLRAVGLDSECFLQVNP